MLIGVDASKTALKQKTGIDNTAYQIILQLEQIDHKNSYYLYTNKPIDKNLKGNVNFKEKLLPFPKFWNKLRLPLALLRDKPEKFLELTNAIPSFAPKKTAVFIHDLAFKFFPETYSSFELILQESAIKIAVNKARRILFSSLANKKDFLKFYKYPEEKIKIVPLAFDETIYRDSNNTKNVLNIDSPYFIFVGRLEKRKNIVRIIDAFNKFKQESKTNHKLVLVGKKGFGYNEIIDKINELGDFKKDIIMTGYVENEKLANLYALSDGLVYPSLYEGFGLPILEAMASGIPVLTSNIPTIKEIAGDAAFYVNPEDVEDIASKMNKIIQKETREALVLKGKNQAKKFSWGKSAQMILNYLEEM